MFRETKDGGGMYEAMGCVGRKARPGFLSPPLRNRLPALCGGASAAVRLWEREGYGRGRGVRAANDGARACRTRGVAPCPRCRPGASPWGRSTTNVLPQAPLAQPLQSVLETRTAGDPDDGPIVWTALSPARWSATMTNLGTPVCAEGRRPWREAQALR